MIDQEILRGGGKIKPLIEKLGIKKLFLVHDNSYVFLPVKKEVEEIRTNIIFFGSVKPNPLYEDICNAVEMFNKEDCDAVMAIGGGSVIDTAKCVKLFCRLDNGKNFLEQEYTCNPIPLIAMPSTAGTGSESTRFSVIYYKGEKQTISNDGILPGYAILNPEILKTLPLYQKKCAFFDALCQAIESWWSVNSTEESIAFSKEAVKILINTMDSYFSGDEKANFNAMEGANIAGKAINITQTTAPHAMSYKLTSLYKLPHGHSVAICLPEVWKFLNENIDKCADKRGPDYVSKTFEDIAAALKYNSVSQAINGFSSKLKEFSLLPPENAAEDDLNILASSVNPIRLKNSPVSIDEKTAKILYNKILKG